MRVPFIWQFQLDLTKDGISSHFDLSSPNKKEVCWEQRYFFPEQSLVVLKGLDKSFLSLKNYYFVSRNDNYILDSEQNIKWRKKKLHHKLLLQIEDHCYCYKKKEKFKLQEDIASIKQLLPKLTINQIDDKEAVINQITQYYTVIPVEKEGLVFVINENNRCGFELSRITVGGKIYHSIVLEAAEKATLQQLKSYLSIEGKPQSYIEFLQHIKAETVEK